jgi:hypothetical protein
VGGILSNGLRFTVVAAPNITSLSNGCARQFGVLIGSPAYRAFSKFW